MTVNSSHETAKIPRDSKFSGSEILNGINLFSIVQKIVCVLHVPFYRPERT